MNTVTPTSRDIERNTCPMHGYVKCLFVSYPYKVNVIADFLNLIMSKAKRKLLFDVPLKDC